MPSNKFSGVLFDLDGTLLNTLEDIADSMNAALAAAGCPVHAVDAYRLFIGNGMEMLARRALPHDRRDDDTVRKCVELMRKEYDARWAEKTRPYGGVVETLEKLHASGILLAVLSNKPDAFTQKAVKKFLPAGYFSVIRGKVDNVPLKPDPASALAVAGELSLLPCEMLYVGDSAVDVCTALAAGMCPVGALWGFRGVDELAEAGAKHIIEHPCFLLDFMKQK